MAAQPPTRRDPPTPDDAAAGLGAATLAQLVAAGAAVGPAAVGAVGKGAAVGAGALPHRTAQAAAEAIERALDGFWMQQLAIARAKARARLGEALPHWAPSMLDRAVAEELAYEEEFKRKSRARWARDLPAALGEPDPEARRKALKALLDRERRYAEQRYAAIVRRVEARVERERVREASPLGAYWTMDPRLKKHTPGCVALAGHFWPWSVIDRVHPPVHATCGCRLWGLDDALRRGWMRADQVPDEADALARARLLARRIDELHGELSEAELREALTEAVGRYDLRYPKGTMKGGEYRPRRGYNAGGIARKKIRKDLRRLLEPPPHAALREQREPVKVNGRTVMVPWDKLWRGTVGGLPFYSPPQSTNVYLAHEPVPRAAGPGLIAKLRDKAAEIAHGERGEQLDAMRARLAAGQGPVMPGEGIGRLALLPLLGYRRTATSQTGAGGRPAVEDRWRDGEGNIVTVTRGNAADGYTEVVGSRVERARTPDAKLLDRPPRDFAEFKADAVAWAQRTAIGHGKALGLTDVTEDPSLSDSSAYRDWDGVVRFGPDVRSAVEAAAARRARGEPLTGPEALDMLIAQQVAMHEASHAVDVEYEYRFHAPGRRNLEEALTEEVGLLEGAKRLRDTGQGDVLQWAADHPDHWQMKGNYRNEREALATALDHAGVAPEDRDAYVYDLKYEADPEQRLPKLARDAAKHGGTDYDEELARVTALMDAPGESPLSAPWTALPALPPEAAELRREGESIRLGRPEGELALRPGSEVYATPEDDPVMRDDEGGGGRGRVVSLDREDDGSWTAQVGYEDGSTGFVHGLRDGEDAPPWLGIEPPASVKGIPEGSRVAWTRPDGKETEGTLDRVLIASPFGGWAFEAVTADGRRAVVTSGSTKGLRRAGESSPGRALTSWRAYHGTSADAAAAIGASGFTAGADGEVWLTQNRGEARGYGPEVVPVTVTARNPYVARMDRAPGENLSWKAARDAGHDAYVIEDAPGGATIISFDPSQVSRRTPERHKGDAGITPTGDASRNAPSELHGARLYHGAHTRFTGFEAGQAAYLAPNPEQAAVFARRFGMEPSPDAKVITVDAAPGRAKDVAAAVDGAIADGDDPQEALDRELAAARAEGYRYATFDHPTGVDGLPDFRATVSLHPNEDLGVPLSAYDREASPGRNPAVALAQAQRWLNEPPPGAPRKERPGQGAPSRDANGQPVYWTGEGPDVGYPRAPWTQTAEEFSADPATWWHGTQWPDMGEGDPGLVHLGDWYTSFEALRARTAYPGLSFIPKDRRVEAPREVWRDKRTGAVGDFFGPGGSPNPGYEDRYERVDNPLYREPFTAHPRMVPVRIEGPMAEGVRADTVGDTWDHVGPPAESILRGQLHRGVHPRQGYFYKNEGEGTYHASGTPADKAALAMVGQYDDARPSLRYPVSAVVPSPDWLRSHEDYVRQALADGRPVPARVLAEYPELRRERSPGRAELRDWSPGQWGKGIVVDGDLVTWATDGRTGSPEHDDAADGLGHMGYDAKIVITPDGFATETGGFLDEGLLRADFPGNAGPTFGTGGDDPSVPGAPVDEADGGSPAWEVERDRRREALSSLVRGHGLKWEPDYDRWWQKRALPQLDRWETGQRSPGRALPASDFDWWERGRWGRGLALTDGTLMLWNEDEGLHGDVMMARGVDPSRVLGRFAIAPDGRVDLDPSIPDEKAVADVLAAKEPELRPVGLIEEQSPGRAADPRQRFIDAELARMAALPQTAEDRIGLAAHAERVAPAEREALLAYTEDPRKMTDAERSTLAALVGRHPLPEPVVAYRKAAAGELDGVSPGDTLAEDRLLSVSLGPTYGIGEDGGSMRLTLPAGTPAYYNPHNDSEHELILPPGLPLRVTSVATSEGKPRVAATAAPEGAPGREAALDRAERDLWRARHGRGDLPAAQRASDAARAALPPASPGSAQGTPDTELGRAFAASLEGEWTLRDGRRLVSRNNDLLASHWGGGTVAEGEVVDPSRPNAMPVGTYRRTLRMEGGVLVVTKDQIWLDPAYRRQGLAAEMDAEMERRWGALGVRRVRIAGTAEDGGYVWARMGYRLDVGAYMQDVAVSERELLDGTPGFEGQHGDDAVRRAVLYRTVEANPATFEDPAERERDHEVMGITGAPEQPSPERVAEVLRSIAAGDLHDVGDVAALPDGRQLLWGADWAGYRDVEPPPPAREASPGRAGRTLADARTGEPIELTLWHGTTPSAIEAIRREGFRAGGSGSWGPGVYLAGSPEMADYYARPDAAGAAASTPEPIPVLARLRSPLVGSIGDLQRQMPGVTADQVPGWLRRRGYDSLVVTYPHSGAEEAVLLDPSAAVPAAPQNAAVADPGGERSPGRVAAPPALRPEFVEKVRAERDVVGPYPGSAPRRWAEERDMSPEEYDAAVAEHVGGLAREADLVVRLDEKYLARFLRGHVANQHEVAHSGGAYIPVQRARAEAGAWEIEGAEPDRGMIDYRSPAAQFAGMHPDRFPVYGYFSQGEDLPTPPGESRYSSRSNNASQYGGAKLVLKPGVKDRTYLFLGDSLGPLERATGMPSPAARPSPLSAQDDPLALTALGPDDVDGTVTPWPYTEAEIFGGVRPGDVDHVELASAPEGDLLAAFAKSRVPWTVGQASDRNRPRVTEAAYDEHLHPRDRLGEWARKPGVEMSPGRAMAAYAERSAKLRPQRLGEMEAAREMGVSVPEYRERVAERLRELTAPGKVRVAMRMPTPGILGLLRDGRAKTQKETGTSGGWQGDRSDAEAPLFGEPASPTDLPVYGYLTTPDEPDPVPENTIVAQYGPWRVVLRDSVRPRTTIFFGDSLSEFDTTTATPVPLDAPTADAVPAYSGTVPLRDLETDPKVAGTPLFFNGWLNAPAVEAQVHGGVTPADVESVEYRPTGQNPAEPPREVADALRSRGIPLTARARIDDVPTSGAGPEYSPGRVPDVAGRVVDAARRGGATVHPRTASEPKEGFAVALEGHSSITPADEFFSGEKGQENGRRVLREWLRREREAFGADTHVGVWLDRAHGEVVLDPVDVFPPDARDEAVAAGRERDQQSIFDLGAGEEIPTGGTGGRPSG